MHVTERNREILHGAMGQWSLVLADYDNKAKTRLAHGNGPNTVLHGQRLRRKERVHLQGQAEVQSSAVPGLRFLCEERE